MAALFSTVWICDPQRIAAASLKQRFSQVFHLRLVGDPQRIAAASLKPGWLRAERYCMHVIRSESLRPIGHIAVIRSESLRPH